jgi:hypothetical protein
MIGWRGRVTWASHRKFAKKPFQQKDSWNGFFVISGMKVRIRGNSIRYRLKQHEVAQFSEAGFFTETTQIGSDADALLCFTLRIASCAQPQVLNTGNHVIVEIPTAVADEWTGTEQVGFDAAISFSNGAELKLLVEKDFACLDRSDEEEVGSYPNPSLNC